MYQKTFELDNVLSGSGTTRITISEFSQLNIDDVIKSEAIVKGYNSSYAGWYCNNNGLLDVTIYLPNNELDVNQKQTSGNNHLKVVGLILQYTKTTDSANSFNFGNTTDYSTDEKIIGTWLDGSYIYQKTYSVQMSSANATIDISSENIDKAWLINGFYDIGVSCVDLNKYLNPNAYSWTNLNVGLNPPYIEFYCGIGTPSLAVATIQYIKKTT